MLHALLDSLHPVLLQPQVHHKLGEGGLRHQGEVGGGVAEVLVEADGERAEKEVVVHLGSNVTELVRQCLQAAAVVINGLFILVKVKKFLLQKNAALKLVVGEKVVQLDPQGAGVIAGAHDRVEQVLGDGGEEPPDDRGIDRGPLGVIHQGAGVHGAIHVVHEIVLAEEQREVRLPREVRGVGGVEDDGDTCADVDVADLGGVDGEGVGVGGGVGRHGGGVVGRRRRRGCREAAQRREAGSAAG